jgi:hypothetical protein
MKIAAIKFSLFAILVFYSCTKDNGIDNNNPEPSIETGTYVGILVNQPVGISTSDFKFEVSKIDARKYSVKQITQGGVPEFYYLIDKAVSPGDIQLEQGGLFKGTIPQQTSGAVTLLGDGQGEPDQTYYVPQRRITFAIQINNSGVRVAFSGVKQ